LRAVDRVPETRVAHPLRFHQPSRGRRHHGDRLSHTRLRASVNALEELHMEFISRLKGFAVADEGQDLLEYALLIALIALVSVGVLKTAGSNVMNIFSSIGTQLATPSS
jgi:pilus assembly protein Flp/PilA